MTEIQLKAKRERDAAAKRAKRAEAKVAGGATSDFSTELGVVIEEIITAPVATVPDALVDSGAQIDAADRLMELSATITKKRAERRPADPKVTVAPIEAGKALTAAGFVFARTEQNASGYIHTDGRAVLVQPSGQWTLLANGLESGGADLTTLLAELAKPAPKRVTKKALRINMVHTRGVHAAAVIKAVRLGAPKTETPIRALEVLHEAEADAAAKRAAKVAAAVPGMPPNVVRAVEMLSNLTDGRFSLHDLRGDKHYGHRLALLKRLFDREHVVVAETGINNLAQVFHSAIGATGNCRAAQDADFAVRCGELLAKVHDVKLAAGKEAKRTVRAVRNSVKPSLTVPGVILPGLKKMSSTARKAAAVAEREALRSDAAHVEPMAQPRPSVKNLGPLDARALRLLKHSNGLVSLKLERWNSQGALHVWCGEDNHIVSGVLTPVLSLDVKTQPLDLATIEALVMAWLDDRKVKKTPEMEDVLRGVVRAIKCITEPFTLAVIVHPIPQPRESAAEPTITAAGVKLLEDPILGVILMQLEKANSQGAICVYNNGTRVGLGVVPPEILKTLRTLSGNVDIVNAAHQLLNPEVPSVPVTSTAARHLTAVMHCKESIMKNTVEASAVEAKTKKFAAKTATEKTAPAKKAAVVKPAKKAAAPRSTSTLTAEQTITVVAETNPYRDGTKAFNTFKLFAKAKTVGKFRELVAAAPEQYEAGYVRYAARDGYIKVK